MSSLITTENGELVETSTMVPSSVLHYGPMPGAYRYTDEALIKKLDGDSKDNKINSYVKLAMFVLVLILATALFRYGVSETKAFNKTRRMENTEAPNVCTRTAASDFIGENVELVVAEIEAMGFSNFQMIAKEDLKLGLMKKQGEVIRVSIAGNPDFQPGEIYNENSTVVIQFHDFA